MGARRFRTSTTLVLQVHKTALTILWQLLSFCGVLLRGKLVRANSPVAFRGPELQVGLSGEMAMNALGKHSTAGALVSAFATLFFLIAPSLHAQDQPVRVEQPEAAPQGQMQADPNATNLPAVDDNITDDESHNPPSRVARISFIDGSVSLQPGGTGDWGLAQRNRPVTIGDKIWVDKDSRAELQAGQIAIHLGSMTALSFLNLDQNVTQIRMPEGRINFRVREIRQGENYEVDTPNLAFTVKEAGAFRIDVNENGDFTSVTAIRGAGEIAASGQVYAVKVGERVDVTGADGSVKVSTGPAPAPDTLDQWAQQRDLAEENSASSKYVNRDTVGYSDLDDYGTWKQDDTYGNVWYPNNVGPDWAPYSDGNWAYVAPWGWTWVGYEPWGFAPYHYGRWVYAGGYWGWAPGPIYAYPFYGPAFVGWLGGFGFGFGFGFGWFPLGWGEPFHPWYHCGYGYWRGINVHNAYFHTGFGWPGAYHNFNYAYAHNIHAVTTASHNAFVNGQAINRSSQHLTEASLRNAQVTNGIHATPTRTSALGAANTSNHVATPSHSVDSRSVMARTTPSASASHSAFHTMNTSNYAGRSNGTPTAHSMSANENGLSASRRSELSNSRPPYATQPGARSNGANNSVRSWSAQGNHTDSGRAPQGFGSSNSNHPTNSWSAAARNGNRPPYAGNGNYSANRPSSSYNGGRSYSPPSYNGNRGYSAPRTYSAPHSYSAPRSYSAPHNSAPHYSAPHSSGGGGSHSSGGGGSHGGGGGGHGGGGHR